MRAFVNSYRPRVFLAGRPERQPVASQSRPGEPAVIEQTFEQYHRQMFERLRLCFRLVHLPGSVALLKMQISGDAVGKLRARVFLDLYLREDLRCDEAFLDRYSSALPKRFFREGAVAQPVNAEFPGVARMIAEDLLAYGSFCTAMQGRTINRQVLLSS